MGRIFLFSTIIAAGFVPAALAAAPAEVEAQDKGAPVAPAAAESPPPAPAPVAAAPAPVREAVAEKPAPAIDPADRDLAAAPAEEIKPGVIDPTALRRGRVVAEHAAAASAAPPRAEERREPAPQPRQEARREPAPAPAPAPVAPPAPVFAERAPEPEPAPAPRDIRRRPIFEVPAAPARVARRAVPAPAEEVATASPDEDRAPWSASGGYRGAPAPAAEEVEAPVRQQAARSPEPQARPVNDPEPRPVYADHARTPPAYPGEEPREREQDIAAEEQVAVADEPYAGPRPDDRGYDDRGYDDRRTAPVPARGPRYAIQDRSVPGYPPVAPRAGRSWGVREERAGADCGGARAERLQQRIRRGAAAGRIDERIAEDLEDEAAYVGDLERSYCASGMNDWRQQRVESHFAQLEDRLQYEEDRDRAWR